LAGTQWCPSVKSNVEGHRECDGHEDRKEQERAETNGR
jgi:hypothetical protein